LVPDGLLGIDQHDVLLAVAIDVRDREAVADAEFVIQRLRAEFRRRGLRQGVEGSGEEKQEQGTLGGWGIRWWRMGILGGE
jgi:hypothetical protein